MQPIRQIIPRSSEDIRKELASTARLLESARGIEENGAVIGLHVDSIPANMSFRQFSDAVVKYANMMSNLPSALQIQDEHTLRAQGLATLADARNPTAVNNDSTEHLGGIFLLSAIHLDRNPPYNKVGGRASLPTKPGLTDRLLRRKGLAFLYAVAGGQFGPAIHLLDQQDAVESVTCEYGDSALIYAILLRNVKLVRRLLQQGWSTECRRASGETPLILAASLGHQSAVELLLEFGADVEARDGRGDTALVAAVLPKTYGETRNSQKEQIALLLLEKGIDPNAQNMRGATALMYASAESAKPFVHLLKDFGAKAAICDAAGRTAGDYSSDELYAYVAWDVPNARDEDEAGLTDALKAAKAFRGEHDDIFGDHDFAVEKCCRTCYHWNNQWVSPSEMTDEEKAELPASVGLGFTARNRCRYAALEWGPKLPAVKEVRISKDEANETCCHAWKDENLLKLLLLNYAHEAIGHKARHPQVRAVPGATKRLRALVKANTSTG